jgi:hypothetical protein
MGGRRRTVHDSNALKKFEGRTALLNLFRMTQLFIRISMLGTAIVLVLQMATLPDKKSTRDIVITNKNRPGMRYRAWRS